jgi:uncharacterized protein YycO
MDELFDSLLNKIKPGDVILTASRKISLFSLFIKMANFFKRGYRKRKWTHAAIYVGEGNVIEAFPQGIVKRNFKEAYFNGEYDLLVLRHKNASLDKLMKAVEFCCKEKGQKYDFRGLLYFLLFNLTPHQLHFLFDNNFIGDCFNVNEAYFCSELVSTGFKEAGIYCFEREPYKVMPIDFYNELLFDIVAKVEIPKKENIIFYLFKTIIFVSLYLLSSFVFPILAVLSGITIISIFAGIVGITKITKRIK